MAEPSSSAFGAADPTCSSRARRSEPLLDVLLRHRPLGIPAGRVVRSGLCQPDGVAYDEDLASRIRELISASPRSPRRRCSAGSPSWSTATCLWPPAVMAGCWCGSTPRTPTRSSPSRTRSPSRCAVGRWTGGCESTPRGVRTRRQLEPWVKRGVAYARSLPPEVLAARRSGYSLGSSSWTARMLPAGSVNQAIVGPWPGSAGRAIPLLVLVEALEALELDAALRERVDGRVDVGDREVEDRVVGGPVVVLLVDEDRVIPADLDQDVLHQGLDAQPERLAVERLRGLGLAGEAAVCLAFVRASLAPFRCGAYCDCCGRTDSSPLRRRRQRATPVGDQAARACRSCPPAATVNLTALGLERSWVKAIPVDPPRSVNDSAASVSTSSGSGGSQLNVKASRSGGSTSRNSPVSWKNRPRAAASRSDSAHRLAPGSRGSGRRIPAAPTTRPAGPDR